MANECKKTFDSEVLLDKGQKEDKGQIVIDTQGGPDGNDITGRLIITGTTTQFPFTGRCLPLSGSASDRIIIFEVDKGGLGKVHYRGIFKVAKKKIECGSIRKSGGGPDDGDTGTWQATQHP